MDFNKLLNQALSAVQKSGLGDTSTLGKIGGGALSAGVASVFLKKKHRKKLIKAGSVAALAGLAYYGYRNWQNKQKTADTAAAPPAALLPPEAFEPQGQQAEDAGRIILQAMVAAAAADGEIDAAEREMIISEAGGDADAWLAAEAAHPATPEQLAQSIGGNRALAAETYLAARMVCADLSRREIVFLAQLAQALGLEDGLVEMLEQQAGF